MGIFLSPDLWLRLKVGPLSSFHETQPSYCCPWVPAIYGVGETNARMKRTLALLPGLGLHRAGSHQAGGRLLHSEGGISKENQYLY